MCWLPRQGDAMQLSLPGLDREKFYLHSSPKASVPFCSRPKSALDEAIGYASRPFAPEDVAVLGGRQSLRCFGLMNVNFIPFLTYLLGSWTTIKMMTPILLGTCSIYIVLHTGISNSPSVAKHYPVLYPRTVLIL